MTTFAWRRRGAEPMRGPRSRTSASRMVKISPTDKNTYRARSQTHLQLLRKLPGPLCFGPLHTWLLMGTVRVVTVRFSLKKILPSACSPRISLTSSIAPLISYPTLALPNSPACRVTFRERALLTSDPEPRTTKGCWWGLREKTPWGSSLAGTLKVKEGGF